MRNLFNIPVTKAILALSLTTACGTTVAPEDEGAAGDAVEVIGEVAEPESTIVDENFRIIYGYTTTTGDRPGEMLVGDPSAVQGVAGVPAWTSDFRLVEQSLDAIGLNCTWGCRPNRDLTMMAVALDADAGTMGQDMQVVAFGADMTATPLLEQPLTGIRQAWFSDDRLVVSRFQLNCEASTGSPRTCYRFEAIDFSGDAGPFEPETLFVFPPADLLADSMYSGRFRLGADGSSLIIQNPEKESVTLWVFSAPDGLRRVSATICQTTDLNGDCAYQSTAPDVTDDAPVALSADGRTLLLAHVADNRELRLARIDTATKDMTWTSLVRTTKDYQLNACYNLPAVWKYTRIQKPLKISGDGNELVFVAASECDIDIGKSWTNILAVPIAAIGATEKVDASFFRLITDFPAEPVPACISILDDCLDISESGRFVVFAGTPLQDSTGRTILDDSPQHYTDREVFVTAFDGLHAPVQVSGNVSYRASSVLCSKDDPWFADATAPDTSDR